MEQNGITRKQARIQMISPVIKHFPWSILGLYGSGFREYGILDNRCCVHRVFNRLDHLHHRQA